MDPTSASADGLRDATRRSLRKKSSKASARFSCNLKAFSAQLQTLSCGFKSGEYFGQFSIALMPNSARACFSFISVEPGLPVHEDSYIRMARKSSPKEWPNSLPHQLGENG